MNPKDAKRQLNLSRWSDIIKERSNSGLSVADYCRRNGVSCNAYYYWQRIIRQTLLDRAAATPTNFVEISIPKEAVQPVPVRTAMLPDTGHFLELIFNDITLRVTDETSPELLVRTLEVIRHVK